MARQEAMADISNFIAGSEAPRVLPEEIEGPAEKTDAPTLSGSSQVVVQEEEERASIAEMRETQEKVSKQRAEESEVAQQLRGTAQALNDSRARIGDGMSEGLQRILSGLAAIPVPGTVLLPVSILLFFFFALLPINGNTRLMWLWLVLSGNAHLTGETLPTAITTTPVVSTVAVRGTNTITPLVGGVDTPPINAGPAAPLVLNRPLPTIMPFGGVGEI